MTLGGLALAVGILVDDATVEIENINRHLRARQAARAGDSRRRARRSRCPAFVSTICICIVFVPMFFLTGVARYLFVPMAEAVVFAMLASYVLSRTLVPTMAKYLLERARAHAGRSRAQPQSVRAAAAGDRRAASSAFATPTAACSSRLRRLAADCSRSASSARASLSLAADPVGRRGLLPVGRQRPVQAAPARADRHAHRGDGGAVRSRRGGASGR